MRAVEFIVENCSGLDLQVSKDSDGVAIRAQANGKLLGNAELFFDEQGRLDPQTLWVDDRYQSQGIAKAMYDHLKSLGYTVIRSWDQTDAGRGFWDKHRGAEVNVWEDLNKGLNILHNPEYYQRVLGAWEDYYGPRLGKKKLDQYSQIVDAINQQGGTVYRAIWVLPGEKPRLDEPGEHWTISPRHAQYYLETTAGHSAYIDLYDEVEPVPYIISATVGPRGITNNDVLLTEFADEFEVNLTSPAAAKIAIVKRARNPFK